MTFRSIPDESERAGIFRCSRLEHRERDQVGEVTRVNERLADVGVPIARQTAEEGFRRVQLGRQIVNLCIKNSGY